jgi:hypothetical protein
LEQDVSTKFLSETFGILSLSRRWNSTLMWSHYASEHSGFCVGFDADDEFFHRPIDAIKTQNKLGTVRYSEQRPIKPKGQLSYASAVELVLTKSPDWAYEQEERMVCLLEDADKVIEAEPFKIALIKVPIVTVKEVIVGLRSSDNTVDAIRSSAEQSGFVVYRAEPAALSFQLDRHRM